MGNKVKKTLAFYCCSNGFGHFKRIIEIAFFLKDVFEIEIYCSVEQYEKFKTPEGIIFNVSHKENIKWDRVIAGDSNEVIDNYYQWISHYGPTSKKYDKVVSDNLVGLLEYRPDLILMGSFLWTDVFYSYLGDNKLTKEDSKLLKKYNPKLITNRYVETQSVKHYDNKLQYGFGCNSNIFKYYQIDNYLVNYSSLKYLPGYINYLEKIKIKYNIEVHNDFSKTSGTLVISRPGVGTITHCIENNLPLVALYSRKDSKEIIELADIIEELNIGYKFNVDNEEDLHKFSLLKSNELMLNSNKLQKNGYKNIAEFLKHYV